MGDVESEQSQDDFEVEVSDIGELDAAANSSKPSYPSPRPRFSPRQRRLQLIVTSSIVVLAALIILASTAPVREFVGGAFMRPTPSPTPMIVPGTDLFYVRADPPWGHLTIDGHAISLPIIKVDPPLRLSRGQHVLVWRADPFTTQICTVTIPSRPSTDSCFYRDTVQLDSGRSAWVITFSVSLAKLSDELRTALIQAAQVALDARQSTDTVQPGELYALSPNNPACRSAQNRFQCYATANQPLKATLSFQLDTNEASNETCIDPEPLCTLSYQDCRLFCTGSFLESSSTQEWDVFAPVLPLWTFATLDGRVLARNVVDNGLGDYAGTQMVDESLMPLHITWDSLGWHVTVPADLNNQNSGYFNPACAATQDEVGSGLLNPPVDANGETLYLQWQLASGTLPAPGCVAVGTTQQIGDTTPTPSTSHPLVAYCLHRFGVLLAANNMAQRSWPFLPLADAYERQLAQQLAARIGGYFRVSATVVSSQGSP